MSNIAVLNKVLSIREIEKKDAQKAHHLATEKFETAATKLYGVLKKKETAEQQYKTYINGVSEIEKIKEQLAYIDNLKSEIIRLQHQVNHARTEMEQKQVKLTEAHVEVKKFEKVIEHRQKEREDEIRKQEQLFMDEISVRQYIDQN